MRIVIAIAISVALASGCGGGDGDTSLGVTWTFDSGDCAANGLETIRVTWGAAGGATTSVDFACVDGGGTLGDIGGGGSFSITAEGLDAAGIVRAESFGTSVTLGASGTGGIPIELHLHPARADVTVSWSLAGGGSCPSGVILPYFVTLYEAPAPGGPLTTQAASTQESCTTGEATLTSVAPGDYVIEVDSRAVTPALRATQPVTVVAGENAVVAVTF